jgi:hypothetical protein
MSMTRRLFSGLAAVAPAAIAKAPGLALGQMSAVGTADPVPGYGGCMEAVPINPAINALFRQMDRHHERKAAAKHIVMREAAGILDPEIQALTSCSPVYRMHLQKKKDERAESVIQKLRDRIDELERLAR